jgi:hypothetical protein
MKKLVCLLFHKRYHSGVAYFGFFDMWTDWSCSKCDRTWTD